jgi:hypothetical protein
LDRGKAKAANHALVSPPVTPLVSPEIRREILLGIYIFCGIFAGLWLSDDFDPVRLQVMSLIVLPATVGYYLMTILSPNYLQKPAATWHRWLLLIALADGHFLLLNDATSGDRHLQRSVHVDGERSVVTIETRRGGLGHLYNRRW